jgi:hypothetical protein
MPERWANLFVNATPYRFARMNGCTEAMGKITQDYDYMFTKKFFLFLELYPAYRRNWENATMMTIIVLFVAVVKLEKHVTADDAAREHV